MTKGHSEFDFEVYFSEVFHNKGGFDVVIANPPYVEHKKLKGISSKLKTFYLTYSGTADLYVYFYEKGLKILKDEGTLVFITSNKFIKTRYGENLRKFFIKYRINEIIDFTEVHIFEALVSSCIFSVLKRSNSDNKIKIAFVNDTLLNFSGVAEFVDKNKFYLDQSSLSEKIWQLQNETKLALKEKIEKDAVRLRETKTVNIFRGVTTGFNPAFIIDEEKRKKLITEDKTNNTIIKPLLQGRNIRKWVFNKTSNFLIFTRKGIDIKEFPSIKKHLSNFKRQLEPSVGRKPGSYNWYEIQDNTAYYPEFEKEKIIWGLTADKWAFAYDNQNHYLPSNGYILTSKEIPIKYLLALMNCKVMEFYFGFIGIMTAGGAFTLKHETINELPIKELSNLEQKPFIDLVDKILAITKAEDYLQNPDRQAQVKEYEKQIDQMVFELYGLTEEEIKIVEGETA
ncbi:MAG TPA: restriction endonuclease [Desulfotomaculum sp.]|nr:restriction endonuclease [Desulfotomaculum sp.]